MRSKVELQRAATLLLMAKSIEERAEAAARLRGSIEQVLVDMDAPLQPNADEIARKDAELIASLHPRIADVPDNELEEFNLLLPWAAMTVDASGRVLGSAWSAAKRARVHSIIERRHVDFDMEFPLKGKHVFEVGCFEGIHTISCANLGARVTAVDGRIENVIKTLVRLWAYNREANVLLWNVEVEPPASVPEKWDVLHHIGVLYHLIDPVSHLHTVLKRTGSAVILDTHVAQDAADTVDEYEVAGKRYPFKKYGEKDLDISPFSGLYDSAKWLLPEDIIAILKDHGFSNTRLVEDRSERNGRRVLIWGFR